MTTCSREVFQNQSSPTDRHFRLIHIGQTSQYGNQLQRSTRAILRNRHDHYARLFLLRPFPGPLGWRPLFLYVCACCAYSLALWAGALSSYPFVQVAPVFLALWAGALCPYVSVCACCACFLALWAGALSSYPFVLVAPILWPSGLAPSLPIRLRLLRLFSGPPGGVPGCFLLLFHGCCC